MKKNAMLKIAAILMVAVLLTTCAVSSTFAKYYTNGTASAPQTARVAKWGVTIASEVDGVFAQKFHGGVASDKTTGLDVAAAEGSDNLLAPGTANGGRIKATLTGTPEVAFQFTTVANVSLTGWNVDGSYYCPLVVTVNGTPVTPGATKDEFAANIAEAISTAGTKKFAAGTAISTVASQVEVQVAWSWAFETGEGAAIAENNAKDNKLAALDATNTISIAVTQSATQIQNYS